MGFNRFIASGPVGSRGKAISGVSLWRVIRPLGSVTGPMKVPLDVLIVEDSETDTKLVVRELRRSGFTPRWERVDTPEALRSALQHRKWQLVISDSSTPRLNALQALSVTKELKPALPFIGVSGLPTEEAVAQPLRAGAAPYLEKDEPQLLRPEC